ncbi:MAG: transglycosylase SLT domain-containing protein [Pseudomonadota bacterium]
MMFGMLLILSGLIIPSPAAANTYSGICDVVARQAAQERGVPVSVMKAITRTETGRNQAGRLTPWPWTVNMEGAGHWFDSRTAAEDYVAKHHARGARSYDVGCFQINYRWHGQHFASIEAMFDPLTNARYAARFLSELFAETGDWSAAAGAYHSRTPKFATRYRTRFDRIRARLDTSGDTAAPPRVANVQADTTAAVTPQVTRQQPRINLYPLLQPGAQAGGMGSLVPNTSNARPALITLNPGVQE